MQIAQYIGLAPYELQACMSCAPSRALTRDPQSAVARDFPRFALQAEPTLVRMTACRSMSRQNFDGPSVHARSELLASGMRPKQITQAVKEGTLVRLRRDHYSMTADTDVDRAVRIGGRLACVSLLSSAGVFVMGAERVHVHIERRMTRLRSPLDRSRSWSDRDRATACLHWWPLTQPPAARGHVELVDAVIQSVRCQDVRAAVATVDSVLHQGLMTRPALRDAFGSLPARYHAVLRLADGTAESGPESLMRLILRQLGVRFQPQVVITGVGRVDFVVEGWLIVECDSRAHHEGWAKQRADRKRDLAAAALGYSTIRPLAEDIMFNRPAVVAALRGLLAARR